jgi:hypothetical protein
MISFAGQSSSLRDCAIDNNSSSIFENYKNCTCLMNSKPKIPDSAGTSYTNIIFIKLSAFLQGKSPDYGYKYVLNE